MPCPHWRYSRRIRRQFVAGTVAESTVAENGDYSRQCGQGFMRTSGAFTVTRTSTNTCNKLAIKISMKIVKYPESLAKTYSTITGIVIV